MTALTPEDRELVAFLRGPILRSQVEALVANMTEQQLIDTAFLFGSLREYLAIFIPHYAKASITQSQEKAA